MSAFPLAFSLKHTAPEFAKNLGPHIVLFKAIFQHVRFRHTRLSHSIVDLLYSTVRKTFHES